MEDIEAAEPRDTAQALTALAKVSSGHLNSVTLFGGFECAWLGAVAQWLLGLAVTCEREDDPDSKYYGHYTKPANAAQVKIIFKSQNARAASTSLS